MWRARREPFNSSLVRSSALSCAIAQVLRALCVSACGRMLVVGDARAHSPATHATMLRDVPALRASRASGARADAAACGDAA